ncbi:Small GTPase [Trypanosoma melophagium]|uniref:Small GTPase n=1 Tax=Trypanosoma melophagium TaxID=715481 RepID=UPI00351A8A4D|nr:Small GTPase [Trypanosoma melophagium]
MPSKVVSKTTTGEGKKDTMGVKGNSSSIKSMNSNGVGKELDIKIVCVGAANTGKTTFLRYWESGETPLHLSTTIQMEFHRREMTITVPSYSYYERQQCFEEASATNTNTDNNNNNNNNTGDNEHSKSSSNQECKVHSRHASQTATRSPIFIPPPSLSSGNHNWNNTNKSSNNYNGLQNPFGDGYRIIPPRMPSFYYTPVTNSNGSSNSRNSEKDNASLGWSLSQVPAIVKVWDIQGQECTKKMTRIFYTGAIAVLIFCEISSSMDSLENALSWKSDVEQKIFIPTTKPSNSTSRDSIKRNTPPYPYQQAKHHSDETQQKGGCVENADYANPPCWLVVNKYDLLPALPTPPTWASHLALDDWCERHRFAGWTYTAGRRGVNVEAVMQALIAEAVGRFPQQFCILSDNNNNNSNNSDNIAVVPRTRNRQQKRREGGCCSK